MTLRRHVLPPGGRSFTRAYTRFVTESPTLTSLAKAGGCAAKYPAARLEKLLAGFVPVDSADLLVGLDPADDAAVYRLDDDRALVFTVDFFPPVVDDPRAFGAIAATNALNDVFAMGGVPLLALSITAFPEELPTEMLGEILAGADEVVRAAGAILAGGHTIRDDEPKYGLAVVGTVHPDGIWPKSGARPGDALFLTKPLGTGLVLQAQREGRRAGGCARRGRGGDAHAQPRGRRCPAAVRAERRDRRDGLRPARARVRDGLAQRRPDRARRRGAARPPLRASSWPRPASGRAATAATATTPARTSRAPPPTRRRRWPSTHRPPAGCSSRSRPTRPPCSSATFAAAELDLFRIGRVADGRGRRATVSGVEIARTLERCARGRRARRSRAVSPRRFRPARDRGACSRSASSSRAGAFVRLTASGLGCDNWPRCGDKPVPEKGGHAAIIEFGNRLVALVGIALTVIAWLAARRVDGSAPLGPLASPSRRALGALAQIPLGGLTVLLELHPLAVMSHFLLALSSSAAPSSSRSRRGACASGRAPPAGPPGSAYVAASGSACRCAVLVVTGTVATASGPHRVGQDIERLGLGITDTVYVHVRATAVFGIGFLIVGASSGSSARELSGHLARLARCCSASSLAQMAVGEIQYRNALPWWLVVIHVSLAATIWTLTVGRSRYALHRPPARAYVSAPLGRRR